MKILSEKRVHTDKYAGCVDLITGIDDFEEEVEFDPLWHSYSLDGESLPSVTRLLDDGMYEKIDKKILEYAQTRGTIVHGEIEEWFKEGVIGFTPEFHNFLDLFEENKEMFENKAIFDFKTYATATPSNRKKCYKQEKMYAEAIKYMTNEEIENFYLVHLPKSGKCRIYDLGKEFGNGND